MIQRALASKDVVACATGDHTLLPLALSRERPDAASDLDPCPLDLGDI